MCLSHARDIDLVQCRCIHFVPCFKICASGYHLGSLSFKNPKRIARTEPTDWEIPAMQWVAANGRQVLALIAEKVDVRKWKLIMVEE
jgi:hypothetical protein